MVEESTIAALEPEQAEVDESEMVEEGVALEVSPPILLEQAEAEREPAEQAEKMEEAPDAQEGEQEEGEKKEGEKVEGDKDGVERQLGEQDGETATAGSDAEENREREAQEVPEHEDAVLAQRDKLTSIMDMEAPDLESASAILDALMSKWDNIDVKQIVDGAKKSLGMVMRRLRKHSNEELSTRANRLFEMYRDEVRTEYDVKMEARRKVKAKAKEKSERKKALSSMSTDKKKTSEKTSERKQKREKKKEEGAEKKKKKRKVKRKASSDEDGKSEEEPEEEEEEEPQESPKKKQKKEKAVKVKKERKKKKPKHDDSDDDDEAEREATPEPAADDVPGRIKYLLRKMIQKADLTALTSRGCKAHIKESFENGDAVCAEHKALIKATIDWEVSLRGNAGPG